MVLLVDPSEWTVNNLEKEQTTRWENLTIAATQLQDHLFLTKTEDKYHLKQTNIMLNHNHKYFYQPSNNNNNFMETHHKEVANMATLHNMAVQQRRLQFKQVNLQVEVLELNSGDLTFYSLKLKNNQIN